MALKKNPTKKQRAVMVVDDDDDETQLLETPTPASDDIDLDEELRQLDQELGEDASSARVVVHKVVPNGDSARCFSCPRSQFFSDRIRDEWGGGTYSVMVYANGKLAKRARLTFAEPIAKPPAVAPGATPPASAYSDATLRDVETRFEQRLEREQARHFELLKLFAGGRPQLDPIQMQQQILTMLSTVKDLTGDKSGGGDRSIELFLEGVKMAQKLGGGGEGTDWGSVAAAVIDGVKTMAQQNQGSGAPPRPPRPLLAAVPTPQDPNKDTNTNGAAAPDGAAASTDGEPNMLEKLRAQLQFLAKAAARKSDPTLYADVALDNLGELPQFMQALALDYLRRPDCLDRLIALEPSIAAHREWFGQCVEEIRRQLSPRDSTDPLTPDGEGPEAGD